VSIPCRWRQDGRFSLPAWCEGKSDGALVFIKSWGYAGSQTRKGFETAATDVRSELKGNHQKRQETGKTR
jgi:hypothetical protein